MAMAALATRIPPKFALVSSYTVNRIGKYPMVNVAYMECNYLLGSTLVISASEDLDADGLAEVLTVQDLGTASLVGHVLADKSSNDVAVITAFERVEVTPETTTTDGAGVTVTTPATYAAKLTLSVGLSAAQLAVPMAVVEKMPVGTNAYANAPDGAQWNISLYGSNPLAMQEMGNLLGGAYFAAAKAIIAQLGLTATDAQILGAIQALAAQGTNLDGFLAQQGEALEAKRQAGTLPFASIMGVAPKP